MIIRFTPEADTELAEARQWYAHQRENLDLEFMQMIDAALSRIVSNPNAYPYVVLLATAFCFLPFHAAGVRLNSRLQRVRTASGSNRIN
jgi:hypothetical protein